MDFQVILNWVLQIFDFLIVDFTHWNFNSKLYVLIGILNTVKNCTNNPGDNSLKLYIFDVWAHHGVGLSWAGLSICENRAVEAF